LHGELDFVTLGFQRAEGELCGGDVEAVEGEFVAGVMVVEGLRGVDEPDPCSCQLSVSRLGHWGWGGSYPVPVATSAMERIFAVGIEGWMGVPPMTSTRKACCALRL
jgi:hypothetical protein